MRLEDEPDHRGPVLGRAVEMVEPLSADDDGCEVRKLGFARKSRDPSVSTGARIESAYPYD